MWVSSNPIYPIALESKVSKLKLFTSCAMTFSSRSGECHSSYTYRDPQALQTGFRCSGNISLFPQLDPTCLTLEQQAANQLWCQLLGGVA